MQRMADEVIDQHGAAAHAQCFPTKASQFSRLQMMREQAAAYQVKTAIRERQRESICDHGPVSAQQVRAPPIEIGDIYSDPFTRQFLRREFRHFAESSSYFQ